MNKRKLLIIAGIIIIIAGLCIFAYPIVRTAYTNYKQKQIMSEIKEQIFENITLAEAQNESLPDTEQNGNEAAQEMESEGTEPGEAAGHVVIPDDVSLDNISEETVVEEENSLNRSRLSGQKCVGIIECDKINLVYAIVEGTSNDNIGVAIGHFKKSAGIGEEGNCALAGHNGGTYGRYFGDIKDLVAGDEIKMTNLLGEEYSYKVYESFVVEPQDTYVVEDLGIPGKYLTMVTCTQHGTKRLIVRAKCDTEPVMAIKAK